MPFLYWLSVTLHVLAAFVWLGGMLFLGAVGAPVLRGVEPAELRQRLFHLLGERFRTVGWLMIALLVVTGVANMHYRGLLQWEGVLGSAAFWRTGLGTSLAWKLATVAFMLVASAVHDFALGPRAGALPAGTPEAIRLRRQASLLARGNALVAIVLVVAAVRLARGG